MLSTLDITSAKMNAYIAETKASYIRNPKIYEKLVEDIKKQKAYEANLLATTQTCPPEINEALLAANLGKLDLRTLESDVSKQFYNPNIVEAMACIADTITTDIEGPGSMESNDRIREYIGGLRQIGAPSSYGVVMSGDIVSGNEKTKPLFILKAPKDVQYAGELVHEVNIAYQCTNRLRLAGIPNYAYIYGSMTCAPPIINDKKEVISFCDSHSVKNADNNSVLYAIYENIAPAISIRDYIKTCSAEDFMAYYVQVLLAIYAGKKYNFTHYDAHNENVLMREISKRKFCYSLPTPNGKVYCRSPQGYIPTIIDFGTSHIQIKDPQSGVMIHLGNVPQNDVPMDSVGLPRNKSCQISDAYKLLCMCLYDMFEYKDGQFKILNPAIEKLIQLMSFFIKSENPYEELIKQRDTYFYMPLDGINENVDLYTFVEYCVEFCRLQGFKAPFTSRPEGEQLQLSGMKMDLPAELKKIGVINEISTTKGINTFPEFADLYTLTYERYIEASKTGDKKTIEDLANQLNKVESNFGRTFISTPLFAAESKRLLSISNQLQPFELYNIPQDYQQMIQPRTLEKSKAYAEKVARFFDAYQRVASALKAVKITYKVIKNDDLKQKVTQLYNSLKTKYDEVADFVDTLRQSLADDIHWLLPSPEDEHYQSYSTSYEIIYRKYKPSLWYWDSYVLLSTFI
jgi:hypothetical protein